MECGRRSFFAAFGSLACGNKIWINAATMRYNILMSCLILAYLVVSHLIWCIRSMHGTKQKWCDAKQCMHHRFEILSWLHYQCCALYMSVWGERLNKKKKKPNAAYAAWLKMFSVGFPLVFVMWQHMRSNHFELFNCVYVCSLLYVTWHWKISLAEWYKPVFFCSGRRAMGIRFLSLFHYQFHLSSTCVQAISCHPERDYSRVPNILLARSLYALRRRPLAPVYFILINLFEMHKQTNCFICAHFKQCVK